MATAQSAIRQHVGRMWNTGGRSFWMGTPAATFTTTGFSCAALCREEADYFKDFWLRFYAGTYKGNAETQVYSSTPSGGPPTTNAVIVFNPALGGAVDANHLFELWRDFPVEIVDKAINLAILKRARNWLLPKTDETLIVDNLLTDGTFESWASSSLLNNYTKGGTGAALARESTVKLSGDYSAKLTNQVSEEAWLYQSLANYAKYAGQVTSLYARVHSATAARVRLRLYDGVNTWNSDYHDGTGWQNGLTDPWLKIENKTLSTAPTELTSSLRIETGGAIDAYIDRMRLQSGGRIYEYTVPSGFHTLTAIYQERGTMGAFSQSEVVDDSRVWGVKRNGSTSTLWFDPRIVSLTPGRALRLVGQQTCPELTADDDTTTMPVDYLVAQTLANLHRSMMKDNKDEHAFQAMAWEAEADRAARGVAVAPRGWAV